MKAYYSGIGSSITMTVDTTELSKRDQIALCHDLMRRIGYTSYIYAGMTEQQRQAMDSGFARCAEAFEKSGS